MSTKKNLSEEQKLECERKKDLINKVEKDDITISELKELLNKKPNSSDIDLTEEQKLRKKLHSINSQLSYIKSKKVLTSTNKETRKRLYKERKQIKKRIKKGENMESEKLVIKKWIHNKCKKKMLKFMKYKLTIKQLLYV